MNTIVQCEKRSDAENDSPGWIIDSEGGVFRLTGKNLGGMIEWRNMCEQSEEDAVERSKLWAGATFGFYVMAV